MVSDERIRLLEWKFGRALCSISVLNPDEDVDGRRRGFVYYIIHAKMFLDKYGISGSTPRGLTYSCNA